MGFPNLDLFLVQAFADRFADAQGDLKEVVDDTFEDFSEELRYKVRAYIDGLTVKTDVREGSSGDTLTILPGFPIEGIGLPQITVVVGSEAGNDWPLGAGEGESEAVYDPADPTTQIGWKVPSAYWATCDYRVQILADGWWEMVWLTRLCQRAIVDSLNDLAALGVHQFSINVADLQLNREHFPGVTFARGISFGCKLPMEWSRTIALDTYATGVNLAVTDP